MNLNLPSPEIVARFEAWWLGELVDRPPVSLWITPPRPPKLPARRHATLRDRWLDAEFTVESFLAGLEVATFAGDTFPVFCPNLGPEITATLWGCELEFGENTSWSHPVVHAPEDWERLLATPPNFDNPYWQTIERLTKLASERCQGRYVVGLTDLHGSYDILAGLRDPEMLCTDLLDCPDLVRRAGEHVARGYVEAFRRDYWQVATAGFGATTWTPLYHNGPAYVPSCDFWCMVSSEIARDLIWPTILAEMQPLERSIFHLDGPQALRHLELLLECPQLHAVQWVAGTGQGSAARWLDVYRRCRQAGKSVQVLATDAADALAVLDALGPRGVWLTVLEPFADAAQAESFLQAVGRAALPTC